MTIEQQKQWWQIQKSKVIELLTYDMASLSIEGKINKYNDLNTVIEAIKMDNMALIADSGCAGVGMRYLKPHCSDIYLSVDKPRTTCARHYLKELHKTWKMLYDAENVHGYGGNK